MGKLEGRRLKSESDQFFPGEGGNIGGGFLKKKSRSRELGLAVSVERIKGKGTLVSAAAKSG